MTEFDQTEGKGIVVIQPGPFWVLKDGIWEYDGALHQKAYDDGNLERINADWIKSAAKTIDFSGLRPPLLSNGKFVSFRDTK